MKQGNATSRKKKIANKNAASKGQQELKAPLASSGKTPSRKTSSSSSFLSNIILVLLFAIFLFVSMLSDETQNSSTTTVRGSVPTSVTRVDDTSFANMQSQMVHTDDNHHDDGSSDTKEEESEDEKEDEKEKESEDEKENESEEDAKDIPIPSSTNSTLTVSQTNSTLNNTNIEEMPKKKKKDPLEGWIYEPKNVNFFWAKMGDRPFQREFYSRLHKFDRILDIGVRGYNRVCKDLINSTNTEYFQIDPFPPAKDEMNNDGLMECYLQEAPEQFPQYKNTFDLVIDFGVFGWEGIQKAFNETDIKQYLDAVRFFLKDGGIWALKTDQGWIQDEQDYFKKHVLDTFDMGKFDDAYESGHKVKGNKFTFYFFYKK